ncbi:AAA family ATPase [Candidatus Puniceispirillum marinum]|uniref:AAA ATPase n=1 Tax=Puniceispirillum marinum (strain IMCC1322) TaxID=488538 RepID=D5BPD7_PUNMI|nr:AAA family ATPase [Candidatus Puniceispirillum marinum]ADE38419.1 AAA ATPase [Candidatus Puniceispirillum marinum IMCC1322]
MSDLTKHIGIVARHYWGEPNIKSSNGSDLRFGTNGSKSVDLDKGCWFDHENEVGGGVVDLVRRQEGIPDGAPVAHILHEKFDIQPLSVPVLSQASKLNETYDYIDAQGELLYQVQRLHPKSFRQRRPDNNGGWIYNLKGVPLLPYRLPALLGNQQGSIFIVEGEKCADELSRLGLLATTNSGGAGSWKPILNHHFQGRNVVIIPDNDDAGRKHAQRVAQNLFGLANSLKILELPGLPEKGDVIDWLTNGNKPQDLVRLADQASIVDQPPIESVDEDKDYYKFLTVEDLYRLPEPRPLVEGLISENSFCVMYGAPGSGKSFCALDIGLSIACGMPWHDKQTQQGSVLFIAGEGVGGLKRRVKAFQRHHGLDAVGSFLILHQAVNFRDESSVQRLLRSIDRTGGNFNAVFVDTVARALPGSDENSATDMGAFVDTCDRIRHHTGAAVIGVHHSGKDMSRGMRGSSALLGAVDTSIEVKNTDGVIRLKNEKQKDHAEHQPIYLKMSEVGLLDGSSVVLELISSDGGQNPLKRPKFRTAHQYAAFQALRNLLIDKKVKKVPVSDWHKAHAGKSPDLSSDKRRGARQQLQDKGLVVINDSMVWINREVEETMEPYHDTKD